MSEEKGSFWNPGAAEQEYANWRASLSAEENAEIDAHKRQQEAEGKANDVYWAEQDRSIAEEEARVKAQDLAAKSENTLLDGGIFGPWYYRYALAAAYLCGTWFLTETFPPDHIMTIVGPMMLVGYAALLARELVLWGAVIAFCVAYPKAALFGVAVWVLWGIISDCCRCKCNH